MWIAPERRSASRWIVPGLILVTGVAVAAVLAVDDRMTTGLIAGGVLAGYALLLSTRRNETGRSSGGAYGGHRSRAQLRAAAVAGDLVTVALVGAVVVEALRGGEILPYAWPAALAGVVYGVTALFGDSGL
ncbi:hypothetical protein GCM10009678_08330 [Actinomadura kijaniata]|uniref:Uncharacterized protein n=1 Tax=Actinomadura namibiensis TaxID=182080 RepID=A0A7W3QQ27_ACTNM|nr:ABC transporter permease [Actinomadura namibiensis]MBA8955270.1 hypothetical protein [Actinomadura namibiensis]